MRMISPWSRWARRGTKMNAQQIVTKMISIEFQKDIAPDARRIIRDERLALQSAIQSKNRERITRQVDEATDVCQMWGYPVDKALE